MSAGRARVREIFLAPPAASGCAPVTQVAERAVPHALGVLCLPGEAALAGAALGLAAAGRAGAPCALVCRWTGAEPGDAGERGGLAPAPARRLAARLAARGLTAAARGRLVTVCLPAEAVVARAAAERAAAAAGEVPVVVVLAGPRPEALDGLLGAQDRLVVVPPAGAPPGLEALALEEAARLGRATGLLRLGGGSGAARAAALAGLPLTGALRAVAAAALDGHAG